MLCSPQYMFLKIIAIQIHLHIATQLAMFNSVYIDRLLIESIGC